MLLHVKSSVVCLNQSPVMERHGLAVAHSISRNKNGVTMIHIMNPNPINNHESSQRREGGKVSFC